MERQGQVREKVTGASDELKATFRKLTPKQRRVLKALPDHDFQFWSLLLSMGYGRASGHRWMRDPDFIRARQLVEDAALDEYGITTQRIMQEVAAIAYADPRKLYDEHGNLLPVQQLDAQTAASIAAIEVEETTDDDGVHVVTRKIRRHDKLKALELAGKYRRLWADDASRTAMPDGPGLTVIVHAGGASAAVAAAPGAQGQVVVNLPGPE